MSLKRGIEKMEKIKEKRKFINQKAKKVLNISILRNFIIKKSKRNHFNNIQEETD